MYSADKFRKAIAKLIHREQEEERSISSSDNFQLSGSLLDNSLAHTKTLNHLKTHKNTQLDFYRPLALKFHPTHPTFKVIEVKTAVIEKEILLRYKFISVHPRSSAVNLLFCTSRKWELLYDRYFHDKADNIDFINAKSHTQSTVSYALEPVSKK